jgi:hypothetical protein
MKYLTITLFFLGLCSISNAQDTNVIGTWNIIEFTMTNEDNVNKMTEDQLNEKKFVWDINLLEDGSITQTSNMRTGETETQEGSWQSTDSKLILKLNFNNQDITIEYNYGLTNDILTLKRGNPTGTMSVETKFRKKA